MIIGKLPETGRIGFTISLAGCAISRVLCSYFNKPPFFGG